MNFIFCTVRELRHYFYVTIYQISYKYAYKVKTYIFYLLHLWHLSTLPHESSVKSLPPLEGRTLQTTRPCDFIERNLPLIRILAKYSYAGWTTIWKNIACTLLSDETRSPWHRVIHGLTPTQARQHGTNTQNTKVCVQRNISKKPQHRLTPRTSTSELWQCTRHGITAVLRTDPRYVPSSGQYSVMSPHGRNKTSHDDRLTGYYVHCVVRNGSSVILRGHMDFLLRASKRYRKWTTSFAIIWKNVRENTYSHLGTPPFNSLERRSLGRPVAACWQQVDRASVH
jgi:hypothetical protein